MKKIGTLNQGLSEVLAGMGHYDMLVIADAGLPIPPGVRRIDLALTAGVPGFVQTLAVILSELQVESAVIAGEMETSSPALRERIDGLLTGIPVDTVSHEEFKKLTRQAVAVVRTGEFTPYANIILKSGVVF
ncbi:D-ribose pyranase [Propionispora hippei]|uniref:D-ribose pyranase n=1 Tax=Propionispora hippei DSM 15287 TaxID=1123003 RepID=A0A1M6HWS7_9FIRM|nr:D-ribose pyranase [Propionispora hippei]SHJ26507.1 D-ribose pyranase [Propionispora hippei DSM 15287]